MYSSRQRTTSLCTWTTCKWVYKSHCQFTLWRWYFILCTSVLSGTCMVWLGTCAFWRAHWIRKYNWKLLSIQNPWIHRGWWQARSRYSVFGKATRMENSWNKILRCNHNWNRLWHLICYGANWCVSTSTMCASRHWWQCKLILCCFTKEKLEPVLWWQNQIQQNVICDEIYIKHIN